MYRHQILISILFHQRKTSNIKVQILLLAPWERRLVFFLSDATETVESSSCCNPHCEPPPKDCSNDDDSTQHFNNDCTHCATNRNLLIRLGTLDVTPVTSTLSLCVWMCVCDVCVCMCASVCVCTCVCNHWDLIILVFNNLNSSKSTFYNYHI